MGQSHSLIFAATLLAACGAPATPAPPPEKPIELPDLVDMVPAAGLDSLVEAHPRALLEHPELLPLIYRVVPQTQLDTFARRHGGVEVDQKQMRDPQHQLAAGGRYLLRVGSKNRRFAWVKVVR